jgi:hypothetical protein
MNLSPMLKSVIVYSYAIAVLWFFPRVVFYSIATLLVSTAAISTTTKIEAPDSRVRASVNFLCCLLLSLATMIIALL